MINWFKRLLGPRPISRIEFERHFWRRIVQHWPDVGPVEAGIWLWDYLDHARFGDPEYEWTANVAREVADCYMRDYGE